MSGIKKEYGDYQTPYDFCKKVCKYLLINNIGLDSEVIFEPTCGIGNFAVAASESYHLPIYAIDINWDYVKELKNKLPNAIINHENIFDVQIHLFCPHKNVLVIGNPPWATNSNLNHNLPQKENFKKLRGMDALTGASNFDICEYVILKMLHSFSESNSVICMLCKTSVARNVILEINRNSISCKKIEMLKFDSQKVFGISVAACILIIQLSTENKNIPITCEIKDFDTFELIEKLIVNGQHLITDSVASQKFEGICPMTWRSGVKHDCGKVMELDSNDGRLINKYKEFVDVENDLIFPLVKSSFFKSPIIKEYKKFVIVTQQKASQDTSYIENDYPQMWSYLNRHIDDFNRRKSVIYKKSGLFSMFGIGDYSFAPYKVGVSGFYKKPLFSLLVSDKPVMTDDTSYFLSFYNYNDAYTMMILLNSPDVQDYLTSIAFLDSKRPYTVKLLSRLDLNKCIQDISFQTLQMTERDLNLNSYISIDMLSHLQYQLLI